MTTSQAGGCRSLSDKALVDKARLSGWRLALQERSAAIGCIFALLLAAVIVAIGLFVVRMNVFGMGFLLFAALLLGISAVPGLEYLSTVGKHGYIRELRRRYGMLPLEDYVEEEKKRPGVLLSILAEGRGLPYGRHHFIRIRLRQDGDAEMASFVSMRQEMRWTDGTPPHDRVSSKRKLLDGPTAGRIKSLASGLAFGQSDTDNAAVTDGFPCRMSVIRHTSGGHYRLECNLAGLSEDARAAPAVELLRELMDLERRLNPVPEVVGSCDPKGEITIEERNPSGRAPPGHRCGRGVSR